MNTKQLAKQVIDLHESGRRISNGHWELATALLDAIEHLGKCSDAIEFLLQGDKACHEYELVEETRAFLKGVSDE